MKNNLNVEASAARSRGLEIIYRHVPHADAWGYSLPPAAAGSLPRFVEVRVATARLRKGRIRKVELHWYEAHGIGKKKMKIKRYLD